MNRRSRIGKANILGVLADREFMSSAENAIEIYGHRWQIETLFGCLKTRGFNFEDTHLTKPERLEKLMAVLTVAFCWAHKIGEWNNELKHAQEK